MAWQLWLRGLLAAVVSAAATGGAAIITDPSHFNLFAGGAKALGEICAAAGVIGALLYLKEHPDPWKDYTK